MDPLDYRLAKLSDVSFPWKQYNKSSFFSPDVVLLKMLLDGLLFLRENWVFQIVLLYLLESFQGVVIKGNTAYVT